MLEIHDHGPVRELRLARAPVNALSAQFCDAIDAGLAEAFAAGEGGGPVRAVVLSGQPGMFSAGLDVREVMASAGSLRALMTAFWRLQRRIVLSPLPVVAALTGHAPAGGTVLAVLCDHRVMADGKFRMGLNEVQVGLFPGETIYRCFERLVGTGRAAALLPRGAMLSPAEALAAGLVDEVAQPDRVIARAMELAAECAALPPKAYRQTRAMVRADLARLFDATPEAIAAQMGDEWVTDETRERMSAILARR
jgi:3,2-trans-enoyl-CoA isomerase